MNYKKYVLFFTILLLSFGNAAAQPYVLPQDSGSAYETTPYLFRGSPYAYVMMMPPQLIMPLPGEPPGPHGGWKANSDAVVLINTSNGVMHFREEGLDFDVAGKQGKTITLPPGKKSEALIYSIQGQQKQITVVIGHRYSLYFDVQHHQIIAFDY